VDHVKIQSVSPLTSVVACKNRELSANGLKPLVAGGIASQDLGVAIVAGLARVQEPEVDRIPKSGDSSYDTS